MTALGARRSARRRLRHWGCPSCLGQARRPRAHNPQWANQAANWRAEPSKQAASKQSIDELW